MSIWILAITGLSVITLLMLLAAVLLGRSLRQPRPDWARARWSDPVFYLELEVLDSWPPAMRCAACPRALSEMVLVFLVAWANRPGEIGVICVDCQERLSPQSP